MNRSVSDGFSELNVEDMIAVTKLPCFRAIDAKRPADGAILCTLPTGKKVLRKGDIKLIEDAINCLIDHII